jgi:uracil-DNA glycosylase
VQGRHDRVSQRPTSFLRIMTDLGSELPGRDFTCYADFQRAPHEPLPGGGARDARLCMFGRDPGREEVRWGVPFVGAGGQKIRRELHERLTTDVPYSLEASLSAGQYVFWANTVPFKPAGNKAWPRKVVRDFRAPVTEFLLTEWQGADVLTFGEVAFHWFGLDDPEVARRLTEHWAREDRFEASVSVVLAAHGTGSREIRLHPVPHPSPLNATWAPHFSRLLRMRLEQLNFAPASWRLEE